MHRTVFSCIQHIREFEQLFDTPDMPSAPKDSTKTADCSLRLVVLNGSESLVSMVWKELGLSAELEDIHEECGIFGVWGHPDAARLTYFGLHALQHRGQEGAGHCLER